MPNVVMPQQLRDIMAHYNKDNNKKASLAVGPGQADMRLHQVPIRPPSSRVIMTVAERGRGPAP